MKPFNMHDPVEVIEMKTGDYVLHGDVIIQRVGDLPSEFTTMDAKKDGILALGEATGHCHALIETVPNSFDLREDRTTGKKHLRIVHPVALRHQEHREIKLPPGDYHIGIQREYDPFTKLIRQVAD